MKATLVLVVLRCADLGRAATFYRALGLTLTEEQHGAGPIHYSCALGEIVLELYPQGGHAGSSGLQLGLRVPDVAFAVASVRSSSTGETVRFTEGDAPEALLEDPDTHRIQLEQHPRRRGGADRR